MISILYMQHCLGDMHFFKNNFLFIVMFLLQKEAPDSLLTSVDVPNVDSIFFHPIIPSCNRAAENVNRVAEKANPVFPLENIPFRFQLDDVHTNFVQVKVVYFHFSRVIDTLRASPQNKIQTV